MQSFIDRAISSNEVLELCIKRQIPFVAYQLPGDKNFSLIIQNQGIPLQFTQFEKIPEKGFIISPFFNNRFNSTIVIEPGIIVHDELDSQVFDELKGINVPYIKNTYHYQYKETGQRDYMSQVEKAIQAIKDKLYEKIVLSRIKTVKGKFRGKLSNIFHLLRNSYPDSFVYFFSIGVDCWMGATPEPLICSDNDDYTTVSLAGTKPYDIKYLDTTNWKNKDIKEQNYVTEYIQKVLRDFGIKKYTKEGPYAKKAAQLLHLRTDFKFKRIGNPDLASLVNHLHPTSAVCGMPKEASRKFIIETEKHDREYYTGFLGPVGINQDLQLFVNLRCMKILDDGLALFTGGGITADSDPLEEWQETEIKTGTLLSIINQVK